MSLFYLFKRTPNVLDAGTKITGNFQSDKDWTICGTIVGVLTVNGNLTIERTAEIRGNVIGKNVRVEGKVFGNIAAKKHLHAASSCKIEGDIFYHSLSIQEGAYISGIMKQSKSASPEAADVKALEPDRVQDRADRSYNRAYDRSYVPNPFFAVPASDEPVVPFRNKSVMHQ